MRENTEKFPAGEESVQDDNQENEMMHKFLNFYYARAEDAVQWGACISPWVWPPPQRLVFSFLSYCQDEYKARIPLEAHSDTPRKKRPPELRQR